MKKSFQVLENGGFLNKQTKQKKKKEEEDSSSSSSSNNNNKKETKYTNNSVSRVPELATAKATDKTSWMRPEYGTVGLNALMRKCNDTKLLVITVVGWLDDLSCTRFCDFVG